MLSPEVSLLLLVVSALPIAIIYLSSDKKFNLFPTLASSFNTIFSFSTFVNISSITSIFAVSNISSKYISIKKRLSFFITKSWTSISFCLNNSIISVFWFSYFSSTSKSFSKSFAILWIAFDTPFSCLPIFFWFSSTFFLHIKLDLLILYDTLITLTICEIFSSKYLLIFLSSNPTT